MNLERRAKRCISTTLVFGGFLFLISSCTSLPKERYRQFQLNPIYESVADSMRIELENPLGIPITISFSAEENTFDSILGSFKDVVVSPYDTFSALIPLSGGFEEAKDEIKLAALYGDGSVLPIDSSKVYSWPFPKGKKYKIIQGYYGKKSHQSTFSKNAIDFNTQIGDTICAALDGVVIGIIDKYDIGGNDRKYRPFANYITLWHVDGTLTQYVHLKKNGVLVALGDSVKRHQPIGISGNTGYSGGPHLHFNAFMFTAGGGEGIPIMFEKGAGKDLKQGTWVSH